MRRKIVWLVVSCLMVLALLAISCAKVEEKAPAPAVKEAAPTLALTLENTDWVLESYGEPGKLQSVLPDVEITARFDSATAQVQGSAGVNRYFGAYTLDGSKFIIPGLMGSTMMAGPQPLMDQETEFLKSLQAAESYQIEGDKLTITCGGKALIFTKK